VTDRRTDGIAVANTALAMRALRRAVKTTYLLCKSVHVTAIGNALASTDSAQSLACSHFLELTTLSSVVNSTIARSSITIQ